MRLHYSRCLRLGNGSLYTRQHDAGLFAAAFVGVLGSVLRTIHWTHKGGNRFVLYSRVDARVEAALHRHRH